MIKSFDINEYDGVVYRPPVGVAGDIAILQDYFVFAPDNAVSQSGQMITVCVSTDEVELIPLSGDKEV